MIRCVMMDLDGTLLRIKDQKTAGISDENEQALIRFEKAGGLTGIATSRSPGYIRHFSRRTWLERCGNSDGRHTAAASAAQTGHQTAVENLSWGSAAEQGGNGDAGQ